MSHSPNKAPQERAIQAISKWFERLNLYSGFRYTSDTVFDTFPWPQFEVSRDDREGGEGKKNFASFASFARLS